MNQLNSFTDNLSQEDSDLIQERKEALNSKREQREIRRYGKIALKERPRSPILNPFSMFVKEKAGEIVKNENFLKHIGQQWRSMSAAEKMVYKQKVSDAVKTYEKDLVEWQEKHDRQK